MSDNLITACLRGYQDGPDSNNPWFVSSNNGSAYKIGQWLKSTRRSAPRSCRPSRGYKFHVNDMLVEVVFVKNDCRIVRLQ